MPASSDTAEKPDKPVKERPVNEQPVNEQPVNEQPVNEQPVKKKRPLKWRRLFRVTHRDVGYALVALTLAYSVSGIAVNHIDDWNPNYRFEEAQVDLGPGFFGPNGSTDAVADISAEQLDAMRTRLVQELEVAPETVRGHFLDGPRKFQVFLVEGGEIVVDPQSGRGSIKQTLTRPGLYEVNVLHLNTLKGAWTYIADLFALGLVFLALTGLFINKGKTGLTGRGKFFVAGGLLVPVAAIIYMYWS